MTYIIGFSPKRVGGKVAETTCPNAKEALEAVHGLQASDETIRFIRAPWGGEIGVRELQMYAEQEVK